MSSKLWRNVALAGVAAAGAAVWAVAPRTFNDKRRNFVPSIPEVWYAHRGLHDAGSGLVGYTDIADYGGDNIKRLYFPKQKVILFEENKNIEDSLKLMIVFGDEKEFLYEVDVMKN